LNRRVLGVIPARLASTRLPNKPLHLLLGRPLLEWVWRRVEAMSVLDHALVATDSEEIADLCRAIGAPVEVTSGSHPSGTDRVAEVASRQGYRGFDVVANIQGDEPLVDERHLASAIRLVREEGWDVGTCATPILTRETLDDAAVVKVVRAEGGRALYFSRAAIPFKRDAPPTEAELGGELFLRHLGIYAYGREALRKWVALPPSPLEQLEKLEQLRPLEAGMGIGVEVVDSAEAGVDTLADAARMEERLRELGYSGPFAKQSR